MPDDCIPKQLLYGKLHHGKRPASKPRKRFKDSLKSSLQDFQITPHSWEEIAADRTTWRGLVHGVHGVHGAQTAEEVRLTADEKKLRVRMIRASRTTHNTPDHPNPHVSNL